MTKYHINPSTGNPGVCVATDGKCRYGEGAPHFSTENDARAAYEAAMSGAFSQQNLTKQQAIAEDVFTVQNVEFESALWNYSPDENETVSIRALEIVTRNKSITLDYGSSFTGGYDVRVLQRQSGNYWGDGEGIYGLASLDEARKAAETMAFEDTKKHLSKLKSYSGKDITSEMVRSDLMKIKAKVAKERAAED